MPGWVAICWALMARLPVSAMGAAMAWATDSAAAGTASLLAPAYLGLGALFLRFLAWNRGLRWAAALE
jgi:hypothetical protein